MLDDNVIMNLLNLAPDIQEAVLHLPRVESGREPVTERDQRTVVAETDWGKQQVMAESSYRSMDESLSGKLLITTHHQRSPQMC